MLPHANVYLIVFLRVSGGGILFGQILNSSTPLLTVVAVCGAFVGAIVTILVTVMRGRYSHRSDVLRLAVETAHQDFIHSVAIAEKKQEKVFPMSSYITFHFVFLRELDSGNDPKSSLRKALQDVKDLLPEYQGKPLSDYETKWKTE